MEESQGICKKRKARANLFAHYLIIVKEFIATSLLITPLRLAFRQSQSDISMTVNPRLPGIRAGNFY